MTELISFKVQVSFAAKRMDNEPALYECATCIAREDPPDHLVQSDTSIDDWGEGRYVRHEVV